MGQRKGMPPRGDELCRKVDEAVKAIDFGKELLKRAREKASRLPAVYKDPPFRPENER